MTYIDLDPTIKAGTLELEVETRVIIPTRLLIDTIKNNPEFKRNLSAGLYTIGSKTYEIVGWDTSSTQLHPLFWKTIKPYARTLDEKYNLTED